MNTSFEKRELLNSALSPYDKYCTGYRGKGPYICTLVIGVGTFKKSFSHPGSEGLDKIVAYDKAEVDEAYIGQINMSLVSSFIGPHGLIWGHDLAKKEGISLPSFFNGEDLKYFEEEGIKIRNGKNLREAGRALLGNGKRKHFPFLPGTHVPCAGKFNPQSGPGILYGVIAIGIPEDRKTAACLLMEDVGKIEGVSVLESSLKSRIALDTVKSVIEVGKNQKVEYKEIFVDLSFKQVKRDEMGCVLVAMPYFHLAKKAYTKELLTQSLEEWYNKTNTLFLEK